MRGFRLVLILTALLGVGGCSARNAVNAATLSAPAGSFGFAADAALTTLERTWYRAPGRWNLCVPTTSCGSAVRDWGADALTYTLFLRWRAQHDASIPPLLSALAATTPNYRSCRLGTCREWSDVPMWDAIAVARDFEVTREPAALRKARAAFALVDHSNAFARGACPSIDYQKPGGGKSQLKTLETDSNYVKAALLLYSLTHDAKYKRKAVVKYAAIRRYFRDPVLPLYTTYVFDDGRRCAQLPRRFFASVNGNMIWAGLALSAMTGNPRYRADALATTRAVTAELNDAAGIYADLQADNDVAEPLIEAMYDLAAGHALPVARTWLLANAASSTPTSSGAYGRFFDGPAPRGTISAWSANGGFALAVAAGALDRAGRSVSPNVWRRARFVTDPVASVPATIVFTGRAIALIGTIGHTCCEPGHVGVRIDGHETVDRTGIWQNKSAALRGLPNSVLLSWRWPAAGRHTIALEPGRYNAKEGGSALHLRGYEFVP